MHRSSINLTRRIGTSDSVSEPFGNIILRVHVSPLGSNSSPPRNMFQVCGALDVKRCRWIYHEEINYERELNK